MLDYFKVIGRVLGLAAPLAVFHYRLLDVYFLPGFYKMVLNNRVNSKDIEAVDGELCKGLTCVHTVSFVERILSPICRENDITDVLERRSP